MFCVPRSGGFGVAAAGLVLSGIVQLCPQPAAAGDWRITPSISTSEAFSDNATLANESQNRQSEFATVVSPGVAVHGSGGRVKLNFDYKLQQTFYLRDTSPDSLRNNLLGGGEVELWDRVLFLRSQASISREVINPTQPISNSPTGLNVNQTTVRSFNVSPIFRHHFGNWADMETTGTMNRFETSNANLADTWLWAENLQANSGQRLLPVGWGLKFSNSELSRSNNRPTERRTDADANVTYRLGSRLSLLAAINWERVRTTALLRNPQGVNWNVGFQYRPGARSTIRAAAGDNNYDVGIDLRPSALTSLSLSAIDRNNQTTINAQASHQLSPRVSIFASYVQTLQTSQQLFSQNLSGLQFDPTGLPIDPNTGLPFVNGTSFFGINNTAFRQKRASVGLNGSRRRFTYGADLFYEEREFQLLAQNQISYGAGVRLGHKLGRRLSSALGLTYRHFDPDLSPNQTEIQALVDATLSYQLSSTAQASLGYGFTQRWVHNSPNDYHENSVILSLRKTF